jgi:Protein of unknown function (DUF454)
MKLLIDRLLGEFKTYADPANQIEVPIQPITNPGPRMAALLAAGACLLIGIPLAVILPVVPASPFAVVGLMLLARASNRFRRWLVQQQAYRIAVTVIYTRTERPFRWLRRCFSALSGLSPISQPTSL